MKRLFIAEKPSMAREIAATLGVTGKGEGHIQCSDDVVVTWLVGHVLRQAQPEEYQDSWAKWTFEHLPMVPEPWMLVVSENSRKQFKVVKALAGQATEIVHAGDPDREGQLLVDEVLEYIGNKKPVKRILLNALDETSIRRALADLRPNVDFQPLKDSALARARADWLIGMNATRAFSLAARRAGHSGVFNVGRVQTPTLALVVRRELEIQGFKPVNYFGIVVDFSHENGDYKATWKPAETCQHLDDEGRLLEKSYAEILLALFAADKEFPLITDYKAEQKQESQRLPFSLSALQIAASKKHGFSPEQVLNMVQGLYEAKHVSYPRSDCDYIPESQHSDAPDILNALAGLGGDLSGKITKADTSIKSRAFNDKKISAHHAIIPTRNTPSNIASLGEGERKIYAMICDAYIAQFYGPHVFNATSVEVTFCKEKFTASGRVTVKAGWRELYGKDDEDESQGDENQALPAMKTGDILSYLGGTIQSKTTKPPKRFTTGTLVEAMKNIHKFVVNEDLKKRLKDSSGIGTEATRASIIKKLFDNGFLVEEKKNIKPTDKAFLHISVLPKEITIADTTATWETILDAISKGKVDIAVFLKQQEAFISSLVNIAQNTTLPAAAKVEDGPKCPKCNKGKLRKINGKKGPFWGCSCYPECSGVFADKKGEPDFAPASKSTPNSKKGGSK